MPPTLSKPSGAVSASLVYITLGGLMTVWSGIWFLYLRNNSVSAHSLQYYLCLGFLISGIGGLALGLFLGPIARMARHAELPPQDVANAAGQAEQTPPIAKRA